MILFLGTTPAVQRSMTFDHLSIDKVNRAISTEVAPAGKSVNAARIAHVLGADVLATGFLGGDTGELIRRALDTQQIRHDFVTLAAPTRVCVTVIDRATSQVTELIEEPAGVEAHAFDALLERVKTWIDRCSVAVLSGSLAPGSPVDFYARCVALAPPERTKWIVDATGDPLKLALKHQPFVVKPNAGELSATVGLPVESDAQLRDAIRALIALGPTWAVVTRGPDPVVVSDGTEFWKLTPSRLKAVSPIGAGDAFAGALAWGLLHNRTMPDACTQAARVASASTLSRLAGEVREADIKMVSILVEEF